MAKTGLAEIVRRRGWETSPPRLRRYWIGVGVAECVVGAALFVGRAAPLVGVAATLFGFTAFGYTVWIRKSAPSAGCGCFGAGGLVSAASIVRALLVLTMGVTYLAAALATPVRLHVATTGLVVAVALAELCVFAVLSSGDATSGGRRVRLGADAIVRGALSIAGGRAGAQRRTEAHPWWEALRRNALPESGLPKRIDTWRAGVWYMLEYRSMWNGTPVTVAVAEHLLVEPRWMRVCIIDETGPSRNIIASWDSAVAARREAMAPANANADVVVVSA